MEELSLTDSEEAISKALDRETALKYIEGKDERKRAMGKSALERLGSEAGEFILHRLRREAAKRKRKLRFLYWGFGIYGAVLVTGLLIWIGLGVATGVWPNFPWQLFQAFSYMGIFGSIGAASQFQKSGVEILAAFDDTKYVPELVDALSYGDKHLSDVARDALTNLLPRLSASDAEILGTEQRKVLLRWLTVSHKDFAFTLAILKALEQVGDERDLPTVRKLAESDAVNHRLKDVYEAARQCLPYVEQRAEQNRIANTLLRAAAPGENEIENLLRPVATSVGNSPQTLLRPTPDSSEVSANSHCPDLPSAPVDNGDSIIRIQTLDQS